MQSPHAKGMPSPHHSGHHTPGMSTFADGLAHLDAASMQALKDQDKAGPICIGDFVSLFVEELNGFMTADGFTDDGLYVQVIAVASADLQSLVPDSGKGHT